MNNSLPGLPNPVTPVNSAVPTPVQPIIQSTQPLAAPIVAEQSTQSKKRSSNVLVIALIVVVLGLAGFIGFALYQLATADVNKNKQATENTNVIVEEEPEIKKDVFFANWYKINNSIAEPTNTTSTYGRIALGLEGSGDVKGNGHPSVIKSGTKYKMWYQGDDKDGVSRIYYAESDDNLTWTKINNSIPANSDTVSIDGRIPLGTAGKADSKAVTNPSVLYKDNEYKMWYCAYDGINRRISYATSPNGLNWTKLDNSIATVSDTTSTNGRIPNGTTGKFDEKDVCSPEVIWEEESKTYKMWYSSVDPGYIGLATSNDGLNWTKLDNSIPEISNTTSTNGRIALGTTGTRDSKFVRNAAVVKIDGKYHLWYVAGDGKNQQSLSYATSPDGLTWTKFDNSMNLFNVISNGYSSNGYLFRGYTDKTIDNAGFGAADLYFENNTLYMYLFGFNTIGRIQTAISYDYLK